MAVVAGYAAQHMTQNRAESAISSWRRAADCLRGNRYGSPEKSSVGALFETTPEANALDSGQIANMCPNPVPVITKICQPFSSTAMQLMSSREVKRNEIRIGHGYPSGPTRSAHSQSKCRWKDHKTRNRRFPGRSAQKRSRESHNVAHRKVMPKTGVIVGGTTGSGHCEEPRVNKSETIPRSRGPAQLPPGRT